MRPTFAWPGLGPVLTLALLVACMALSAVVPPFQSPDEFDHVKRAYLLARGQILLDAPSGQSSGGEVDTGLLAYMDAYRPIPLHGERKLGASENQTAQGIRWSGLGEFSAAPGTGFYFPLIYAPQAAGLALAKALGRSVDTAYRWSRLFALLASTGLVLIAFSVYAPPPLAAGLLLLPMSLFQLSSATIDGLSAALTLLVLSCFMRIACDREASRPWHFYAMAIALSLLVSSRVHGLPLLALLCAVCTSRQRRVRWIVAGGAIVFVLGWIMIAASTTVQLGAGPSGSKSSVAIRYLTEPLSFLHAVAATLQASPYAMSYRYSFVGVLGWLDAAFPSRVYRAVWLLLACLLLVSVAPIDWRRTGLARALLVACALASFLLVFFAMLVTWSPDSASFIEGVQGRYFLLPAMVLAYAVGAGATPEHPRRHVLGAALLVILLLFSSFETIRLLLDRYYLA